MMKRWIVLPVGMLAVALVFGSNPQPVSAVPNFKKAFDAMYVQKDSPLAKAVETAKCNICHEGESKKKKNAYGMAVGTLLKKSDKDNADKINAALKSVEGTKVDTKNATSPTFGDNIKAGKLPAGG